MKIYLFSIFNLNVLNVFLTIVAETALDNTLP